MFRALPRAFTELATKVIEMEVTDGTHLPALHRLYPCPSSHRHNNAGRAQNGELIFLDPSDPDDIVHMSSDDTGWDASFCPYLRTPLHLFLAMNDLPDPLAPIADAFRILVPASGPRALLARDSYGHTPYEFTAQQNALRRREQQRALARHGAGSPDGSNPNSPTRQATTAAAAAAAALDSATDTAAPTDRYDSYFQRVLLNACPAADAGACRDLNYAARKGALFLWTTATLVKGEPKHHLWRELRGFDAALFKRIASFL